MVAGFQAGLIWELRVLLRVGSCQEDDRNRVEQRAPPAELGGSSIDNRSVEMTNEGRRESVASPDGSWD